MAFATISDQKGNKRRGQNMHHVKEDVRKVQHVQEYVH